MSSEVHGYLDFCAAEIGCDIPEHVRPVRLPQPYSMIVDDSGAVKNLPVNLLASILYGADQHGCPICGTALIMKDVMAYGGMDIVSLDDSDIPIVQDVLSRIEKIAKGFKY